jgi:hypothetical protein
MASSEGQSPTAETGSAQSSGSRFGKFIQTYHTFLSSFVIGAAGLIATSIWQYRQAETAKRQADAQLEIAKRQADNNWRIERAQILAKNLQVLSAPGAGNLEERYGVILSLTRGELLDPELAVSYALDLGKEKPEYMRSVLNSTANKDYSRLARAFEPTCEERYGVSRPVELCQNDKLADRSAAIAQLIWDEVQIGPGSKADGPMVLLDDERQAQLHATRLAALFSPALVSYYERRQWAQISQFEARSPGARLVAALVLAQARTGELVSEEEAANLEKFHADRRKWLTEYLLGTKCDLECRGKLVEVMLTGYKEAEGDYDLPMRTLLERSRTQSSSTISHLHSRLLWCQVDGEDLAPFRDRVLVPALTDLVSKPRPNPESMEDLVGLLALVKSPRDDAAQGAWKSLLALLDKPGNAQYAKMHLDKRSQAARDRSSPPAAMKKNNFCIIPADAEAPPVRKASASQN